MTDETSKIIVYEIYCSASLLIINLTDANLRNKDAALRRLVSRGAATTKKGDLFIYWGGGGHVVLLC